MKTKTNAKGIRVATAIKAGPGAGIFVNHSTTTKQLRVKSAAKLGGPILQHNASKKGVAMKTKTNVKAGDWRLNHGVRVKTSTKAGGLNAVNHNTSTTKPKKGVRVRTTIKAGPGSGAGGVWLNHGVRVKTATNRASEVTRS